MFVWFSLFADQASVDKHQRALAQSMQWREGAGEVERLDASRDRDVASRADRTIAIAARLDHRVAVSRGYSSCMATT